MSSNSFKDVIYHPEFANYVFYIYIYIYKQDLTLNNLQGLICHKTQPTIQPINLSKS